MKGFSSRSNSPSSSEEEEIGWEQQDKVSRFVLKSWWIGEGRDPPAEEGDRGEDRSSTRARLETWSRGEDEGEGCLRGLRGRRDGEEGGELTGEFKGEVSGELGGEGTRTKVKSIGWDCWILWFHSEVRESVLIS